MANKNQTAYILYSQRWRSSIQSAKTRPGADCASDRELLITKFRVKLKKVGKTTRPFRYAAATAKSLQSCPTLCNPIRRQPTRLLRPWDSPGKNTGVGIQV